MTERVAIILTNYNMPERTDRLVEGIRSWVKSPYDFYIVDNGSDLVEPSKYTNVFIPENVQTTAGWLSGLNAAGKSGKDYLAYWFLITSSEYVGKEDALAPMLSLMRVQYDCVGIHSSLTEDSTTAWKHLYNDGTLLPRKTWMIDNISSLYRKTWFDKIGWFDSELKYGWGIDLETSMLARKDHRSLWVHNGSVIKKVTDVGYSMNRMRMTAPERQQVAGENMHTVFNKKYGVNGFEFVVNSWRDDDTGK